jgi:branched-chain amino acid transport system permease protein
LEFIGSMLIQIGIFIILATSFNLIIGYGGLMSIAHPIFFALGAYGSALITQSMGVPVPVGILFGATLATMASIALALPSLRVSGDYLVIASIGFQLGVLQIIKNSDWSGGPGGLANFPPMISTTGAAAIWSYVAIVGIAASATIFIVHWLVSGEFGRSITAMRDDEEAFKGLGHDAVSVKLVLFAIGSGLAGLAGGLYGHYFLFVTPEQFEVLYSAAMLTMVVVGGIRTVWGPALGAVLLQFMPQAINFLKLPSSVNGPLQGILFTSLVLVFLFLRPHGLLGRAPGARAVVQEDDPAEAPAK